MALVLKNRTALWITGVVIFCVVAVSLFLIFRKKGNKINNALYPKTAADVDASAFPLKVGSDGIYVEMLQRYLLARGCQLPYYGADGHFGEETVVALRSLTGTDTVSLDAFKNLYRHSEFTSIF
jgi:hypothetical protein